MNHQEAATSEAPTKGSMRRRFWGERGAVGTEMAIVVAIVVAIAVALGTIMRDSAENHQECIPVEVGEEVPEEC